MDDNFINSVAVLQEKYNSSKDTQEKDKLYKELLEKYEAAQRRIAELEAEKDKNKLPTKDEVDTMASMLDIINKLDASTIEKLNKFSNK